MVSLALLRPAAQPPRAPAQPAVDRPSADRLRAVTELLTRGFAVVTTHDDQGAPLGTAADSAGAVSLTAALVHACIDERSATLAALLAHRRFALNVLAPSQPEVARRFSDDPARDPFTRVGHLTIAGLPVLEDAAAALHCELHDIADGGPLTIVVGRVVGVSG